MHALPSVDSGSAGVPKGHCDSQVRSANIATCSDTRKQYLDPGMEATPGSIEAYILKQLATHSFPLLPLKFISDPDARNSAREALQLVVPRIRGKVVDEVEAALGQYLERSRPATPVAKKGEVCLWVQTFYYTVIRSWLVRESLRGRSFLHRMCCDAFIPLVCPRSFHDEHRNKTAAEAVAAMQCFQVERLDKILWDSWSELEQVLKVNEMDVPAMFNSFLDTEYFNIMRVVCGLIKPAQVSQPFDDSSAEQDMRCGITRVRDLADGKTVTTAVKGRYRQATNPKKRHSVQKAAVRRRLREAAEVSVTSLGSQDVWQPTNTETSTKVELDTNMSERRKKSEILRRRDVVRRMCESSHSLCYPVIRAFLVQESLQGCSLMHTIGGDVSKSFISPRSFVDEYRNQMVVEVVAAMLGFSVERFDESQVHAWAMMEKVLSASGTDVYQLFNSFVDTEYRMIMQVVCSRHQYAQVARPLEEISAGGHPRRELVSGRETADGNTSCKEDTSVQKATKPMKRRSAQQTGVQRERCGRSDQEPSSVAQGVFRPPQAHTSTPIGKATKKSTGGKKRQTLRRQAVLRQIHAGCHLKPRHQHSGLPSDKQPTVQMEKGAKRPNVSAWRPSGSKKARTHQMTRCSSQGFTGLRSARRQSSSAANQR